MKITGAVALALIAGILDSTNSQSSESTLQSACIRNGEPNAWENLQNSKSNYINCIASVESEIRQGFQDSSVGIDPVLTLYCNKVPILKDCIRDMMGSVNSCLDPDQRLLAGLNMDVTLLAIDFPCLNRLLISIVFATTNKQCLTSKIDAARSCGQELLFGSNSSELVFTFKNQTCSSVQKFVQCALGLFGACESQVLSLVLNTLSSFLNSGILCKGLSDLPNSLVSGVGSVTNVLTGAPNVNQPQGGLVTNILSPVTNQLLPGIL